MLIGLILAAAAVAAPPTDAVRPEERPAYEAMLAVKAREAERTYSGSACESAKVRRLGAQLVVSVADHPELMLWRERVKVSGCGRSSIQNINVGRTGGSPPWRMAAGLPGDSLADMTLQQNAYPAAITEARASVPSGCRHQALTDVYIAARPGGVDVSLPDAPAAAANGARPFVKLPDSAKELAPKLDLAQAWMEVWPFQFCGRDRTLEVVFVPIRDQSTSLYLFLPVWRQIEAQGPRARPVPAPGG
ncbi:MAG: hypothetical protein JO127_06630 [Caulobacteraceae bacterium]|nr:hypothetical protein [Caulobacteraceae bacterium]